MYLVLVSYSVVPAGHLCMCRYTCTGLVPRFPPCAHAKIKFSPFIFASARGGSLGTRLVIHAYNYSCTSSNLSPHSDRVSVPRLTLQASQRPRLHRRRSFDITDSMHGTLSGDFMHTNQQNHEQCFRYQGTAPPFPSLFF